MRILITGIGGFIGSHLAKHFVALNHDIIGADRFTYAGKARRLGDAIERIQLLIGDLAQGDLPQRCVEAAPEVVIHCAAETHVDRSIMDPTTFFYANVIGTSRLLDAFAKASHPPPRMFVYSTDEVYGPQSGYGPSDLRTEDAPFRPSNAYAASKVGVEAISHAMRVTHGLPITIVRPCNVYGRGQHPEKAIPRWTQSLLQGRKAPLFRGGKEFRDWMHTTDHCAAIECLVMAPSLAWPVYNVARADWHTNGFVLESIVSILGKDPARFEDYIEHIDPRKGHDAGYAMDGRRLQKLGFVPKIRFEDGLYDQVEWMKSHMDFWDHDAIRLSR